MTDDRYYIKIVPHRGDVIHRFVVRRSHLAVVAAVLLLLLAGSLAGGALQFSRLGRERAALVRIAGQTQALHRQLQHLVRENEQITTMIGAPVHHRASHASKRVSWENGSPDLALVESHVTSLSQASAALASQADAERRLVVRVLNLRRIQAMTRERLLAFIPSIDPVQGAPIVGCFCYRTYPDVEFHEGVDLGADYGDAVHAAAAGTVVAAGWDGGYGIKIDIDHGNGYHTWYAHLSRVDVTIGEHVYKGETIAAVGATGFATGPHLHYQVMLDGRPVNPTPYLSGVPPTVVASLP